MILLELDIKKHVMIGESNFLWNNVEAHMIDAKKVIC
jgi:hypothetical protein